MGAFFGCLFGALILVCIIGMATDQITARLERIAEALEKMVNEDDVAT